MTRAQWLRAGAGALGGALLAACQAPGSGAPSGAKTAQPVALTHWYGLARTHPTGEAFYSTLEEQADELRAKLGVTVTTEVANTEKIMVAAAGGTPPNTAGIAYWDSSRLFVAGMTVNPDEALKKEKEWGAQRKDIFPGMLNSSLWQGKLTAIPQDTNNRGIYYDKGVLAKAGVAPPTSNWTRDEFTEKVVRASSPPDRWGFTITPGYLDFLIFYGAAGGSIQNTDQTKWTIDNETGREALRYLHELIYRRQAIPAPPPGELMRRGEGKVAFDITGNFRLPTIREAGVDVGAASIPLHKTKFTLAHGWNVAIFKVNSLDAQHAAARFAMWLNAPRFQVPFLVKGDNIPVSKGALEHKDFQAYLARDPVVKVFNEQAPHAHRVPASPSLLKAQQTLSEFIKKALTNELGLNAALSEAQRAIQLLLDEDLKQSAR
ncbi:MAG: extracellular solute-binding protein [Chloroflexi bacterium]|nr:extracellular solute-binding protein [Chloroflexota bacterium]